MSSTHPLPRICAVVPAYKVHNFVVNVVNGLFDYVDHVFVVDDACPHASGHTVEQAFSGHPQVTVLRLPDNLGVGGAVMAGYKAAAEQGFEILIKVDGDGQMDPSFIPSLIAPIVAGEADYTKGNRFFEPDGLRSMPLVRLVGNAGLSFLTKLSTGYWQIMDPTNGFTAIHADVLPWIKLERVAQRYFFETDLLFRLGIVNAVVMDIPMPARYGDEVSNLRVGQALTDFSRKHAARIAKRITYQYFLRGFSLGSLCLALAMPLILFATLFGGYEWYRSITTGIPATAGSIMLAALPAMVGIQLLLSFFSLDMARHASKPLWILLYQRNNHTRRTHAPEKQGSQN
ncbi:glycosyltransferase family 2 protein [Chitinimonas sp. BJYL2]|uniref:glycosyltransferase family 2 protein n=1 Tax=Chitinimonas sp. BJYL2 TaxID=2976696 RepID=UPI0022B50A31|nr:glycosyltransferase family 2 protein [Chitinimonas sp. BJYL2]